MESVAKRIDISLGLEPVKIPIEGVKLEDIPSFLGHFEQYIIDSDFSNGKLLSSLSRQGDVNTDSHSISSDDENSGAETSDSAAWGCSCPTSTSEQTCGILNGDQCDCVSSFGHFYTLPSSSNSKQKYQTLQLDALPPNLPLVECGATCECGEQCTNRSTQGGVRVPMVVRRLSWDRGIGVFYSPSDTADILSRGTFIALYAGEYLTTEEARIRWRQTGPFPQTQTISLDSSRPSESAKRRPGQTNYILSLRLPRQTIHIDPRYRGNVGRFLNHSCDPNCVIHPVFWGGGSGSCWARAAIFSKRIVQTGEELTFDYADASGQRDSDRKWNDGEDLVDIDELGTGVQPGDSSIAKRTRCLCGSKRCRGWMPFDETL